VRVKCIPILIGYDARRRARSARRIKTPTGSSPPRRATGARSRPTARRSITARPWCPTPRGAVQPSGRAAHGVGTAIRAAARAI